MSETWYSAAEIAAALGVVRRAVELQARKRAWAWRRRTAKGGGRVYAFSSLPPHYRDALARARSLNTGAGLEGSAVVAPAAGAPSLATADTAQSPVSDDPAGAGLWDFFARAPQRVKDEAGRRLRLVQAVEALQDGGTRKISAIAHVARQADVPAATLRRWIDDVADLAKSDRLAALAPRWRGRTTTRTIDPRVWDFVKADWLRQDRPALSAVYARLKRAAAAEGWGELPAIATLQRRLSRELGPQAIALARFGPEAARRMYPSQIRDKSALGALEAVVGDGRKHDLFVRWPDGTTLRPVSLVWQDVYSGKILAWRIGRSESAELVRLAFGDLVERHGVPEHAVLDNGRGFAAKWITGGTPTRFRFQIRAEDPVGILTQLGITVHWAQPYSGQSKPIERAFRDLAESIDKHPAFAGAWCGNRPDARPEEYAGKAIPLAEFSAIYAQEVAAHNAREGRRSPTCAGRSFDATFAESYARRPIRKASPAQRALWLLAAEGVTARAPDGAVWLGANRYWTEVLTRHIGQKLVVRFDPQRLDAPVLVHDLGGRFLAEAPCTELGGFFSHEDAREHARLRKQNLALARRKLDNARRMDALQAAKYLPAPAPAPLPETTVIQLVTGSPSRAALRARLAEADEDFARGVAAEAEEQRRRFGAL